MTRIFSLPYLRTDPNTTGICSNADKPSNPHAKRCGIRPSPMPPENHVMRRATEKKAVSVTGRNRLDKIM
jgi:hypothetical protein